MKQISQMAKKRFRIGELARELQVKKFVIRFWEKEFGLKSDRSQGGQRYYTHDDFKAFNTIKFLLYKKGFTIAGAKIELENMLKKNIAQPIEQPAKEITAATQTKFERVSSLPKDFLEKINVLKKKLIALKKNL